LRKVQHSQVAAMKHTHSSSCSWLRSISTCAQAGPFGVSQRDRRIEPQHSLNSTRRAPPPDRASGRRSRPSGRGFPPRRARKDYT
jgi:hypothetical protein